MKTFKNLLLLIVLTTPVLASAQSYVLSTNLTLTNTVAASATLTYLGTNTLDLTRYRTFAISATGAGTNISTNTLTFTFLASPTGTNWESAPRYTLSGTIYGTNPFTLLTNLSCDGIGYVKPFQIVSSVTNEITNVWTYGGLKVYPRN